MPARLTLSSGLATLALALAIPAGYFAAWLVG